MCVRVTSILRWIRRNASTFHENAVHSGSMELKRISRATVGDVLLNTITRCKLAKRNPFLGSNTAIGNTHQFITYTYRKSYRNRVMLSCVTCACSRRTHFLWLTCHVSCIGLTCASVVGEPESWRCRSATTVDFHCSRQWDGHRNGVTRTQKKKKM